VKLTSSKRVGCTVLAIAAIAVLIGLSVGTKQSRSREIVAQTGLPPLPSGAVIEAAQIDGDFTLQNVTLVFSAPAAQFDEWHKAVIDWNPKQAPESILRHTLNIFPTEHRIAFSATISHK